MELRQVPARPFARRIHRQATVRENGVGSVGFQRRNSLLGRCWCCTGECRRVPVP
jgi:hypothetical protein